MFCDMIDQIIEFNIMSPLLGDGYKAGGIGETIKTHPLVPWPPTWPSCFRRSMPTAILHPIATSARLS